MTTQTVVFSNTALPPFSGLTLKHAVSIFTLSCYYLSLDTCELVQSENGLDLKIRHDREHKDLRFDHVLTLTVTRIPPELRAESWYLDFVDACRRLSAGGVELAQGATEEERQIMLRWDGVFVLPNKNLFLTKLDVDE